MVEKGWTAVNTLTVSSYTYPTAKYLPSLENLTVWGLFVAVIKVNKGLKVNASHI
jgi:hypothetical protein